MNIIVTGASRGIGYQIVKELAKDNHKIVAISRNKEALEELAADCQNQVYPISYDLGLLGKDEGSDLIEKVLKVLPTVDILINNAGILQKGPFFEFSLKNFKEIFDVNFFAIVRLIQLLVPHMGKQNLGHIVNISSMGGVQGSSKFPGLTAYSSTKSALNGLTECLAVELKDHNIRTNSLALGSVQTEMLAQAFPGYKASVTAEEMGKFIAQFALIGHHYFNGKILPVSSSTP
jgi:NAD(P)-dependent dehydrogenase (short-subunit alcohol dehydrogenase family)